MKKLASTTAVILFLTITLLVSLTPTKEVYALVQSKITRVQAEQRALKMINYAWTYSEPKNGNLDPKDTSDVTKPSQFNDVTTIKTTGIPYNWGGLDSLDSHSYSATWQNFQGAIKMGAYAGNVKLDSGKGLISGTAGIDCSGFVQASFNIHDTKLSTFSLFNSYFTKIKLTSIKHMDILDRPGDHVVIFDKWGTLNGVKGAFTYESTPDKVYGGIQGTKKYFLTMTDLNNGYIPGRYRYILDSAPAPVPAPNLKHKYAKITNVKRKANIRAKASVSSAIIATIPKGTKVYLIDYSKGLYKIKYHGKTGWIYKNLVK